MRPFKCVYLAAALTLFPVQLLVPSAQSQSGTTPSPREPIVEDTRAAPYNAEARPETAIEAGKLRSVLGIQVRTCLLYTSPSPRDRQKSRMPSSA